jgi:hypothetical protein
MFNFCLSEHYFCGRVYWPIVPFVLSKSISFHPPSSPSTSISHLLSSIHSFIPIVTRFGTELTLMSSLAGFLDSRHLI